MGTMGFPSGSVVKNPPANAGDSGDLFWILGSRRSPGGGSNNPFQYSCWGKSHGQRNLVCCSSWGCKKLHTTEHSHTQGLWMEMQIWRESIGDSGIHWGSPFLLWAAFIDLVNTIKCVQDWQIFRAGESDIWCVGYAFEIKLESMRAPYWMPAKNHDFSISNK